MFKEKNTTSQGLSRATIFIHSDEWEQNFWQKKEIRQKTLQVNYYTGEKSARQQNTVIQSECTWRNDVGKVLFYFLVQQCRCGKKSIDFETNSDFLFRYFWFKYGHSLPGMLKFEFNFFTRSRHCSVHSFIHYMNP